MLTTLLVFSAHASPPTLCTPGETAWFSCTVKGGKLVSLCHDEGLAYRFGEPGEVELAVPAEGHATTPFEASKENTGEDSARHVFSVHHEGHRYAISVDRTEDQFDAMLTVHKGGEPLTTLPCTAMGPVDLTTDLGPLAGDPTTPEAWVGVWSQGDSRFRLRAAGDGLELVDGPVLERVGPTRLTLKQGECTMALVRTGPDRLTLEDAHGCGSDLAAPGGYRRAPN